METEAVLSDSLQSSIVTLEMPYEPPLKAEEPIQYVVGYLIDHLSNAVLLQKKTHPHWQAGSFNGVGGKGEEGETPIIAMIREFLEETGVTVTDWKETVILRPMDDKYRVHFFIATKENGMFPVSQTDEQVEWFPLRNLPEPLVTHVDWTLLLSLAFVIGPTYVRVP